VTTTVPVLMYHSVAPTTTDTFGEFTVTPTRFAEQLDALCDDGWRPVTFATAAAMLRGEQPAVAKAVAITVDDGLADFHTYALPVLAARAAAATLFVPSAFVGDTARWLPGADGDRPLLTWSALAEVAASGVEIGSHGHRHVPFDIGSANVMFDEAARSRAVLQDRLGIDITGLAFPYGYQSRQGRAAVTAAGYTAACSVIGLTATGHDHRYALPRLAMLQEHDPASLLRLVSRPYTSLERRLSRGKQHLWTAARRTGMVGRIGTPDPQPVAGVQ
jgi:peptidoglycan/xylan/chitin deacetylase (PgdA/CDA1 family)